jgi:hypothetical protein
MFKLFGCTNVEDICAADASKLQAACQVTSLCARTAPPARQPALPPVRPRPPGGSCPQPSSSRTPAPGAGGALQEVLDELEVPPSFPAGNPERAVYCSRTLNMRAIKTIGYDMDYTLIHYDSVAWEG